MNTLKRTRGLIGASPAAKAARNSASGAKANVFTLRWLMFAAGDQSIVAARSPAFDVVFMSMLEQFVVINDQWRPEDAVGLVTLAMMTLFYFKELFIGITTASADTIAAGGCADDGGDDDEADVVCAELPTALKSKLVIVVCKVNEIMVYADSLDDEIGGIRQIQRKFSANLSFLAAQSRANASNHVYDSLLGFSEAVNGMVWSVNEAEITVESATAYFHRSPAVNDAIAAVDAKRTMMSRTASMSGHITRAADDISTMKVALMTLARMIEALEAKIDVALPPPPIEGDSQSSRASLSSVGDLMDSMRVACGDADAGEDAGSAAAAVANAGGDDDDDDDDGGARASPMAS